MDKPKLYIVATPIGNLGDMTFRAVETLKTVDFALCEDTRVSQKLLDYYGIKTKTISYHQHSDAKKTKEIKELLTQGKNLALITDAGTPGISDPGNKLIEDLKDADIEIIPIPGASAVTACLSVSGFPTDKFVFMGFPPHKNKRQKFFKELADNKYTTVFYESGHRIQKALNDLRNVLAPNRQIFIGREMTKKFESFYRGTIEEILKTPISDKGEFVIVVRTYSKK